MVNEYEKTCTISMWSMIERFADAHLGIWLEVFAGSSELASELPLSTATSMRTDCRIQIDDTPSKFNGNKSVADRSSFAGWSVDAPCVCATVADLVLLDSGINLPAATR